MKYSWEYYSNISQSNITWKSIIIGYLDNCAGNTAKTFLTTSIAYAIFKTWLICNNDSNDGIHFGNYDVFNSVKRNVKHYLCMYCSITKKR